MAVSRRLRYEILRRDNHQCRYCGATAPDAKLTVDHVLPSALGGTDEASNLVTACADCNSGKSASTPDAALVEDVSQDQVRWGRAMALAVEQRAAELAADRQRRARFDELWRQWNYADGSEIPRDGNWQNSVLRFMAAGLDDEFLADAITTAAGNRRIRNADVWRYFCGICWREVEKLQALAAQHVQAPTTHPVAAGEIVDGVQVGGLHPEFAVVNHAEGFVVDLLEHIGAPDGVSVLAVRGLWVGMEDAYKAFLDGPGELWESADDRASEEFQSTTAWFLAEIQRICQQAGATV